MHDQFLSKIQRYCGLWPEADRQRWLLLLRREANPLQMLREAVAWRQSSLLAYTIGYSYALRWLAETDHLRLKQPPEQRWTPALVNGYVRALAAQGKSSSTIHTYVIAVDRVLSQIAETVDRTYIADQLKKLSRDSIEGANDKRRRLQEARALFACGMDHMAEARKMGPRDRWGRTRFRSGFQIAFLARRPLRIKNFASLEIGTNIVHNGSRFWIWVEASETKKEKPIDLAFPSDLVDAYVEYVAVWRNPPSGPQAKDNRLWVSTRGGPQGENAIYKQVVKWTALTFGEGKADPNDWAVNPHLFRDCFATSIASDDPAEDDLVHHVLGNTPSTVEKTYDHVRTREAGREVARLLSQYRR